jgi:protein-disulfide isomerase
MSVKKFMNRQLLSAFLVSIACTTSNGATTTFDGTTAQAIVATRAADSRMLADSFTKRIDAARIQGDSTAKVWMIMASDFQCPYCKQWHDESFAALRREYVDNGKIRLAYYNFPLTIHPNAVPAAEAAMCAGAQNKFWPMHDALFASQATWAGLKDPGSVFDSLGVKVGLDAHSFNTCRSTHATLPMIKADQDRAERAGVQSTPTIIIGNKLIAGALPTDTFRRALDAALAAK